MEEDVGLAGGEAEAEQENTAQISRDHPADKQGSGNQPGDRKYSTFYLRNGVTQILYFSHRFLQ